MSGLSVFYLDLGFKCDKGTFDKLKEEFLEQKDHGTFEDLILEYDEKEGRGEVRVVDAEVFRSFDMQLVNLNDLCKKYGPHLEGAYIIDSGIDKIRADIDGTKDSREMFDWANLTWIIFFKASQVKELKEYAKKKFPGQLPE